MSELKDAWKVIEELGFDWISVWDHFYAAAPPFDAPVFDAVVAQSALAATTQRVRVGCLVYCTASSPPGCSRKRRYRDRPSLGRAHGNGLRRGMAPVRV